MAKYPLDSTSPLPLSRCLERYGVARERALKIELRIGKRITSLTKTAYCPPVIGGITVWKPNRRRALFYWGKTFKGLDRIIRDLLRDCLGSSFKNVCVSSVVNPSESAWRTATVTESMGY